MTRQREAVLEAVRASHEHPDADRVYRIVREQIPNVSLGTVYRSLAFLCEANFIQEIRQDNGPARYDANTSDHAHVKCVHCDTMVDVTLGPVRDLEEAAQKQSGFATIVESELLFRGVCRSCSTEHPPSAPS